MASTSQCGVSSASRPLGKAASPAKGEDKYVLVKASDLQAGVRSTPTPCKDDFSDTASVSGELLTQPDDPFSKGYEKPPLLRQVAGCDVKQQASKSSCLVSKPEAKSFKRLGSLSSYRSVNGIAKNPNRKEEEGVVVRNVYSQAFGCDAGGTADVTADITPWSNTTEWSALTALYNEYKVLDVQVEILPFSRWTRATSPLSSNALAVGFNAVSSALPAGIRQIEELTDHVLFYPRLVLAGATPAADVYSTDTNGRPRSLKFTIPKGSQFVGSGAVYTSDWTSTAVPIPPGALKLYAQTSNVSQNICICFVTCVVAFRQRAM
jgi:hypothetical protein